MNALPRWQMRLLRQQLTVLSPTVARRQTRLRAYAQCLPKAVWYRSLTDSQIATSSGLRLPILLPPFAREPVLQALQKAGYYLRDVWYDAPVAPQKCLTLLPDPQQITKQFPRQTVATELTKSILNLPTHHEISQRDISRICQIITRACRL